MNRIESKAYLLMHDNIDTDQIIPAKFLKATSKEGFGDHLFYNWRFKSNDDEDLLFPINSETKGNSILIAGNNFGCGSSREHAAWAISDFGIKVIISSEFADIFKGNAYNNGILPIELRQELIALMSAAIKNNPFAEIKIDLEKQLVVMEEIGLEERFEISLLKKELLLNDTNETEYLINMREEIEDFETAYAILNL